MQQTRQHILEVLKEKGQATVEEIVEALGTRIGNITAVTVRHHLEILRGDGLVEAPTVRRRTTPGRPQHVYTLTDKALDLFPNNYRNLMGELLNQIKARLPEREINVILEGVANEMAAPAAVQDMPISQRLNEVVDYLTQQGYDARWEAVEQGYMLRTGNCPYHHLAAEHQELCTMDLRMITNLLGGIVPRRVSHMIEGDDTCAYFIPEADVQTTQT